LILGATVSGKKQDTFTDCTKQLTIKENYVKNSCIDLESTNSDDLQVDYEARDRILACLNSSTFNRLRIQLSIENSSKICINELFSRYKRAIDSELRLLESDLALLINKKCVITSWKILEIA
jgi:hypothetical protein